MSLQQSLELHSAKRSHTYTISKQKTRACTVMLSFMINPSYLNVSLLSGCAKPRKGTQRRHHNQHPPPTRTTSTHNQHKFTFNSFLSTNNSIYIYSSMFSIGAKQNQKCTLPSVFCFAKMKRSPNGQHETIITENSTWFSPSTLWDGTLKFDSLSLLEEPVRTLASISSISIDTHAWTSANTLYTALAVQFL